MAFSVCSSRWMLLMLRGRRNSIVKSHAMLTMKASIVSFLAALFFTVSLANAGPAQDSHVSERPRLSATPATKNTKMPFMFDLSVFALIVLLLFTPRLEGQRSVLGCCDGFKDRIRHFKNDLHGLFFKLTCDRSYLLAPWS